MTDQIKTTNAAIQQQRENETIQKQRELIAHYENRINEIADLVAHVRHEINNPLTGVLGQAQLLLRDELSDKARKRVETIEQLAIRLRDLTAELRQVQKPANFSAPPK